MKKFITTLLIIAIGMPSLSFAAGPSMRITQYPLDVLVLQSVTLRLSGGTNLAQSMITWTVEDEEVLTQKGATSYALRIGPNSDPIEIRVWVTDPQGLKTYVDYTVQPRRIGTAPLTRFRTVAVNKVDGITLRINPPGPRGFDKITASITTPKQEVSAFFADSAVKVDWYLYNEATSSHTGIDYTFRLGPSTTPVPIEARVTKDGAVVYTIKYLLKPFDDGMINPADNLSRAMSCTADALDLVANNAEYTEAMVNQSLREIDGLVFQLSENIEIINDSIEGIQRDIEADIVSAQTIGKKYPKSWSDIAGAFRWAANVVRMALKLKDGGSAMRRYIRVKKAIEFITTFQDTLEKMKDQKLNMLKSMQGQLERQQQRCEKAYKKVNTHGL